MSTNSYLQLGELQVLVVRKRVKNLHLSVLPPAGGVRVTSPDSMNDDAIRTLIATRLSWIRQQQAKFVGQRRQTAREYVSGESHYLFGKRYRLEVTVKDAPPDVRLKGKTKILLQVRPDSPAKKRHEVMSAWYRQQLQLLLEELMAKWQAEMGVTASSWDIRQMKTRWGSCYSKSRRILLNLELAKKPLACIEYIVVHELLHLIEKKHNDHFVELMTKYLPKWRAIKQELNYFILSHTEWNVS